MLRASRSPRRRHHGRRVVTVESLEERTLLSGIIDSEIPLPDYQFQTRQFTPGQDGNFWFFEGDSIGRLAPDGTVTRFSLKTYSNPTAIITAPNGDIWFSRTETQINQPDLMPGCQMVLDPLSLMLNNDPSDLNYYAYQWYLEKCTPSMTSGNSETSPPQQVPVDLEIDRMSPSGEILDRTTIMNDPGGVRVNDFAIGPDGDLWYTLSNEVIGRLSKSSAVLDLGGVNDNPNSGAPFFEAPFFIGITTGPDGAMWFTETGPDKIGRIGPDGQVREFSLPGGTDHDPKEIVSGPDGNLWFTEFSASTSVGDVARMTLDGQVTRFPLSPTTVYPRDLTVGPDGNLWLLVGQNQDHSNALRDSRPPET